MNKSHLGTADNPQSDLVTAHDIGRLVDVQNIGKGFLRYVGPIHGKEGLFCGIELLEPNGKHDGSYQGVSYFIATPQHGIFAPIFRITLDADELKKGSQQVQNTQNRLSRSALPALNLRNSFTSSPNEAPKVSTAQQQQNQPNTDVMMTSVYGISSARSSSKPIPIGGNLMASNDPMQMSMYSDMMDGSMFSNGSWSDIADSMITSNCTFTVRKGPMIPNDDDGDLMSVPMVKSVFNIDREALRREEQLQSSVVLTESKVGVENLPVIEDEDELETPLVEVRNITNSRNPFENDANLNPFLLPQNQEEILPPPPQETCTHVENVTINGNPEVKDVVPLEETVKETDVKKTTSPPMSTTSEESKPKIAAKKASAVAPVAAPAAPKFPVKPKAPSKHQLMMEQLKASIEAEKNKPKKEVKSRVSLLAPPAAPAKSQKENREGEMTETPRKSVAAKTPLKSVNKTPPPPPPVERVKKERKPLYVAPPPKERTEKEKEKKVATKPVITPPKTAERKPVSSSIASTSSSKKEPFPTSSFAGSRPTRKMSSASSTTSSARPQNIRKPVKIDDAEKLRRLQASAKALDALLIVLQKQERETEEKLKSVEKQYDRKLVEVSELRGLLEEAKKKFEYEIEQLKSSNQQVVRNHANSIDEMGKRFEAQLAERTKEYERTIDDEKARRDAEMFAMSNRHQKVVACLDEKIAEAEKQCEELKVDKKTLQAALANDCDQRNQMLTKEISSLQTALEMKSAEMKELRQKNQNLSLQVDEIPLKELEISKWRHKSTEYKQMLDQKINGEKILVQQIEELRRKQMQDEEEKEAMKRSFDLMQFKYENGDDSNVSAVIESRFSTPTKVQFRSRSSASGTRPTSMSTSVDNRLSNSSHGDHDSMTRSTIAMYMSQVKLPENHAEDVIYAPDEIISSRAGSISQRLAIAIEDDGEPTLKSESNHQSDSGIGLVM